MQPNIHIPNIAINVFVSFVKLKSHVSMYLPRVIACNVCRRSINRVIFHARAELIYRNSKIPSFLSAAVTAKRQFVGV